MRQLSILKITKYIPYLILALLTLADGITTNWLIGSGMGYEGNSFIGSLAGSNNLFVVKFVGVLIAIYCLIRISQKHPRLAKWVTLGCIAFYGLVLSWNLAIVWFLRV